MPLQIKAPQQQILPSMAQTPRMGQAPDNGMGALSQSVGQVAQSMSQAVERIQNRQDAVQRARDFSVYQERVNTEFRRISTEDDISKPEVMRGFGQFASDLQNELLSNHPGSEESKAKLFERTESERAKVIDIAAQSSLTVGKKLVADTLGNKLSGAVAKVRQDPRQLSAAMDTLDADVADMAGAMPPEEERAFKEKARASLVESSFDYFIERGQIKDAEQLLTETPGVAEALGPDATRKLFDRIGQARAAQSKARNEQTVKGIPVSIYNGLTADQQLKALGVAPGDSSAFGDSVPGLTLNMFAEKAPAFANRTLSPIEDRQFIAAVTNYIQPRQYQDPTTGLMQTVRNELPSYVRDAMRVRGVHLAVTEPPPPVHAAPKRGDGGAASGGPTGKDGKTVFEMADSLTGPIARAKSAVGGLPIVGGGFPEETESQQYVLQMQRDLILTLQNNPHYVEGERKAIEKDIEIAGKVMDNPQAFRQRLIGIDDALQKRFENAMKTASSTKVGKDKRVAAMNIANAIENFRANLAPPRVNSPEEARSFAKDNPPGTRFMFKKDGDWIVYSTKGQ